MPQEMPQTLPEGVNPEYVVLVDGVYYDLCVSAGCKKNTGVRTDCHVEQRKNYIEGCGQFCADCCSKIHTISLSFC